jgi:hypothetical protein
MGLFGATRMQEPDRSMRFDFIRGLAIIAGTSGPFSARRIRAIQSWRARRFSRIK